MTAPGAATGRVGLALAAVVVLNLPLGTVYAFSVLLRALEAALGATRAELSFVFAMALICFTGGMNLAPALYRVAAPWVLVLGCAAVAAGGMVLAAMAASVVHLALGYGLLFGLGGGIAYVLLVQGVNLMLTRRQGLVNGIIVSLYPMGAMIGAPLMAWSLAQWGLRPTLLGLAAVLAATGLVTAGLVVASGMYLRPTGPQPPLPALYTSSIFWRLWLIFFLASAAGLTVLSQAAAMVEAYGGAKAVAVFATTGITGCITAARIGGGVLADRFTAPRVMAAAHALALGGNALLLALPGPQVAIASLAMVGLGYGLVSGSTAAAVAAYWGGAQYGRIAARLYVAWCVAAVTLPVLAGRLFDLSGGYGVAVLIAAGGNLLGAGIAASLPQRAPGRLKVPPARV